MIDSTKESYTDLLLKSPRPGKDEPPWSQISLFCTSIVLFMLCKSQIKDCMNVYTILDFREKCSWCYEIAFIFLWDCVPGFKTIMLRDKKHHIKESCSRINNTLLRDLQYHTTGQRLWCCGIIKNQRINLLFTNWPYNISLEPKNLTKVTKVSNLLFLLFFIDFI